MLPSSSLLSLLLSSSSSLPALPLPCPLCLRPLLLYFIPVEAPVAQRQAIACHLAHRGCTQGPWSGVVGWFVLQSLFRAGAGQWYRNSAPTLHPANSGRRGWMWALGTALSRWWSHPLSLKVMPALHRGQWLSWRWSAVVVVVAGAMVILGSSCDYNTYN
jgi:hypothetical protein